MRQYEDAIEVHENGRKHSANNVFTHINLTAAYIASGREEKARHQAEEVLRLDPAFSLDRYAETIINHKDEAERYIDLLRKAGMK